MRQPTTLWKRLATVGLTAVWGCADAPSADTARSSETTLAARAEKAAAAAQDHPSEDSGVSLEAQEQLRQAVEEFIATAQNRPWGVVRELWGVDGVPTAGLAAGGLSPSASLGDALSFAVDPRDSRQVVVGISGSEDEALAAQGPLRDAHVTVELSYRLEVDTPPRLVGGTLVLAELDDEGSVAQSIYEVGSDGSLQELRGELARDAMQECEACRSAWSAVISFVLEVVSDVEISGKIFAWAFGKCLAWTSPLIALGGPLGLLAWAGGSAVCTAVVGAVVFWGVRQAIHVGSDALSSMFCGTLVAACGEGALDQVSCVGRREDFDAYNHVYYRVPGIDLRRNLTRVWGDMRFDLRIWGVPNRGKIRRELWDELTLERSERPDSVRRLGNWSGLQGISWTDPQERIRVNKYAFDDQRLYLTHLKQGDGKTVALHCR